MNKIITLIAVLSIPMLLISSCKKYEEAKPLRNDPGLPLPDSLLDYGDSHLLWEVLAVKREYIDATGKTDSVVEPPVFLDYQIIDFRTNVNNGEKVYEIRDDDNPLNLLIPQKGAWALSADGRKLTFSGSQVPGSGPGGTFDVGYFPTTYYYTPYQVDGKITRSLAGSRKLFESFTLQAKMP